MRGPYAAALQGARSAGRPMSECVRCTSFFRDGGGTGHNAASRAIVRQRRGQTLQSDRGTGGAREYLQTERPEVDREQTNVWSPQTKGPGFFRISVYDSKSSSPGPAVTVEHANSKSSYSHREFKILPRIHSTAKKTEVTHDADGADHQGPGARDRGTGVG